jgi:hypothetical protein
MVLCDKIKFDQKKVDQSEDDDGSEYSDEEYPTRCRFKKNVGKRLSCRRKFLRDYRDSKMIKQNRSRKKKKLFVPRENLIYTTQVQGALHCGCGPVCCCDYIFNKSPRNEYEIMLDDIMRIVASW